MIEIISAHKMLFLLCNAMKDAAQKWISVSLFNLLIVAIIGVTLRYKIAYALPVVNQKYLLHAHSHFAFTGWVSMALMTLLVQYLAHHQNPHAFKKYKPVLWANLMAAYGMLFTFPFEGYAAASITFSTLSIIVSYVFAVLYWKDLKKIQWYSTTHAYFKAAVLFNALSSIGVFALAYMMATQHIEQNNYLASVYFFLHFQYNGWFLFACLGLWNHLLEQSGMNTEKLKWLFYLFAGSCIPDYFLSAPWIPIPTIVYWLVVAAAFAQVIAWIMMIQIILQNKKQLLTQVPQFTKIVLFPVAIAFSIKLLLQLGSAIPALSTLTYGFRPIVIGYLHLVLLGVISLYIIAHCLVSEIIILTPGIKKGMIVFIAGILLNELLLMIEGIADLSYHAVPYTNEALLFAALVLMAGIFGLNFKNKRTY
ncbi:MAG: hypothetical protein EKK39_08135 [Sphingobacteriales bacterium]|uniref:hypothetical protein n=1 Tax=Hydrotalea flava TaxID=714549 RepID=UPI000A4BFD8F|nr:hypothetical protein [Hydrotalea flava]RTL51565.1 MAG: hypothetical protein EKK39_08135 [Sphingobacteriales bacterium]